ncbi:substrate-binding periplasmic protein [Thalassomonas actiniarum]|uniref:Transporter substrate-binding domain-containing protein n=1 Tax=Thalassomonas actiniarum TaxID=485447 RepID=A0AAE9YVN1_9GAMM|nr:transporter substrate-binding domain-containing protein [Thalassomonas actiniarum]WDE02096.1 transporter substrate-binding domain-containing protein [Thalassomonas actiniarum]
MKVPQLFLFLALPAVSLANAKECDLVHVGCSNSWYPVSFLLPTDKDKATGIAVEATRMAAKQLGLSIKFNCIMPWARVVSAMDTGEIDMLAGHYFTEERDKNWLVGNAITSDDVRAVYRRKELSIHTVTDLKYLHGAKVRGAKNGDFIDKYTSGDLPDYPISEIVDYDQLLDLVLKGRVDYVLRSKRDALEYIKMYGLEDTLFLSESLTMNPVHISFSKKSACAHLLGKFNQLFEQYKKTGIVEKLSINAIQAYWSGAEVSPLFPQKSAVN